MSILIKMEMPKNCAECPVNIEVCKRGYKYLLAHPELYDKRTDDCPLIELPPHGRLIDEKDICDKIRPLIENPYCYSRLQVISETLGNCLQIVRDAPTIIPAESAEEKDETDGEDRV